MWCSDACRQPISRCDCMCECGNKRLCLISHEIALAGYGRSGHALGPHEIPQYLNLHKRSVFGLDCL